MIQIDKVEWGKIVVDNREYRQVLIIGDEVFERDSEKLHQLFKTTHRIGDWEEKKLFSNQPEVIVIGTGFDGVLEVREEIKVKSAELGIELKILKTPQVIDEYNQLVKEGKRVNALIHTTC